VSKVYSILALIPDSWKRRAEGAVGTAILAYAGPHAQALAGAVWACLRAHYHF
jgi:hypothetical protein